ncbi:MAG: DUF1775 domain-containing protein [Acidobacteriota bacterium]
MRLKQFVCLLAVGAFFAAQAFAHVSVNPRRAISGTHHVAFTVRAPVEKDIPTVELKIIIPPEWKEAGGQVDRVELDPLWDVTIERDEDDWIKSVTWSGAEAPDYSFIQFNLIITLPKLTGQQQIKAYQKYSDGSVVAWVEDRTEEGVEKPAAALMLVEEDGGTNMAFYMGLSGLFGGLIGAGLVLIISRKNNHNGS